MAERGAARELGGAGAEEDCEMGNAASSGKSGRCAVKGGEESSVSSDARAFVTAKKRQVSN